MTTNFFFPPISFQKLSPSLLAYYLRSKLMTKRTVTKLHEESPSICKYVNFGLHHWSSPSLLLKKSSIMFEIWKKVLIIFHFYLQVGLIIIIFLLFITSLYDLIFARRSTGDPTVVRDPTGVEATTFNNPGFREKNRGGM